MTPRRILVAVVVIVFVSLGIIRLLRNDSRELTNRVSGKSGVTAGSSHTKLDQPGISLNESQSATPFPNDVAGQPALSAPDPKELSTTECPPLAALLGAPDTKPEAEAGIVLDVLDIYRRLYGAYPAGENNRQFVNALLGANRDKLPFIPRNHPRLNASGEIVDAWGTPFSFHLNSRVSVEVRSAGADRLLYTADDVVAGKAPDNYGQANIPDNELTAN